jgi:hypothetical protein
MQAVESGMSIRVILEPNRIWKTEELHELLGQHVTTRTGSEPIQIGFAESVTLDEFTTVLERTDNYYKEHISELTDTERLNGIVCQKSISHSLDYFESGGLSPLAELVNALSFAAFGLNVFTVPSTRELNPLSNRYIAMKDRSSFFTLEESNGDSRQVTRHEIYAQAREARARMIPGSDQHVKLSQALSSYENHFKPKGKIPERIFA